MDPRGKNTPLIVVTILVCLVGLGVLNYVQTKANPTEAEKQEQAKEQQDAAEKQSKIAAAKAASAPPDSTPPKPLDSTPVAPSGGAANASLPSELVIGNPATAKVKITVGYTYDDATAQSAGGASAVIKAAQDWAVKHPNDSVQVVCVDLPQDQLTNPADASVPLGISVDGKQPPGLEVNPGEGKDTAVNVQSLLGPIP